MPKSSSSYHWLMLLSYDGSAYHGWQVQPQAITLQSTLEKALLQITQTPTSVWGSGRTDAGVHAFNQTANFSTSTDLTAQKWRRALNGVLPHDIVVKALLPISEDFHARHSSIEKHYRYLIHHRPFPSVFSKQHAWWIPQELDIPAMQDAATALVGTHNFSSFRASNCGAPDPTKTIYSLSIHPDTAQQPLIAIDVAGSGFLKNMVRIIVGTLVDVGLKKTKPQDMKAILGAYDREAAGKTAPAQGLYVLKVGYPPGQVIWPEGTEVNELF